MSAVLSRVAPVAANDAGLLFHVTIRTPDGVLSGYSGRFVDSTEAAQHAVEGSPDRSKVTVRPDVETTFLHGKVRFPEVLHVDATQEAWAGWFTAKAEADARANDRRALFTQMQRPDVHTLACLGGAA